MEISIAERLREFRVRTGCRMSTISKATGIAIDNLYKWQKGTAPRNMTNYKALLDYLEKMENSQDEPVPTAPRSAFLQISLRRPTHVVPVSEGNVSPGAVTFINDEPYLIVYYIAAPFLEMIDGAVDVTGDAMSPTYPNGSKIAIARLVDTNLIFWGEAYFIIDKNWCGIVRRVFPDKTSGSILLTADNSDTARYPPIARQWDQVEAVFRIIAGINRH